MYFDKKEEMNLIKQELLKITEIYDNAVKFLITSSLTIISLGITVNSTLLLILTYPIIFLFGRKIFFWRDSIAKKGAYCCVFLEGNDSGLHWETINSYVPGKEKAVKSRTIDFTKDTEINFLLILNTVVVFLKTFDLSRGTTDTAGYITLGVSVVLMLLVGFYFLRKESVAKVREHWIAYFTTVKTTLEKETEGGQA